MAMKNIFQINSRILPVASMIIVFILMSAMILTDNQPKIKSVTIPNDGGFPEIGTLGSVPIPADNPQNEAKVKLGKMLFFDTRLSGDGSTSCATCHDPQMGWGDGGEISRGYPGSIHWRNSQTIINSAYYPKLFWDGSSNSLEAQAEAAATGNLAGNVDPMMAEERLAQIPDYIKLFKQAFGNDRPLFSDAMKAIAAYERDEPISRNVPFDKFVKGEANAISDEAKKGLALFQGKAGCIQCHNGPMFTDFDYHNLGVPRQKLFEQNPLLQAALRYQHFSKGTKESVYRNADRDLGLYYVTKRDEDKDKFRTPSLRYISFTPPYMHNGVFFTLEEVIDFYNTGGGTELPTKKDLRMKPLNLTKEEKKALVAFLETLSGDEIIVEIPTLPQYTKYK
jgi:cytochrome c peroxidase